ncbi:transcription termination factor 5, mitochondrial-like [Galleria mellonella]|uniref:Transcription termination factor 5, mitochondrial-like n=1 Tax=Galleria mellonella TaxID=7137 RepID=A0ABM3MR43_GALME|nr:transcription termination factor 5, mitochondrial-like [Galleria mellonella]
MNFSNKLRMGLLHWRPLHRCSSNIARTPRNEYLLESLRKYLNISEPKAEFMCLKYPVVKRLDEKSIIHMIESVHKLGFSKKILVDEPSLFSLLPVTLIFRYRVLQECGFVDIQPADLLGYLPLVKQKSIGELKKMGLIPSHINLENRLASHMTQWPTSLTNLIYEDVNKYSLYILRLKIIQRYLELLLDISIEEFYRGVKTYPTIKHRPLKTINETLNILQSQIMVPNYKIKSNFYLIHADPDNLKNIIHNFKTIGGIDIKEIIRLHPKLATKNYNTLVEIRKVLQEYSISNEAQRRCFDIYTLSPTTIKERIESAKKIPEFSTFFNHPRFLKMIHYKKTAMKRLANLYSNNKKCLSLNILSGSSAHFETFEKTPGDRLGKGKDLIFCISQCLENDYSASDIRKLIKRHPFWINIPLVQVKYVYEQLCTEFSKSDIYENCFILLYPWSKIKDILEVIDSQSTQRLPQDINEQLNINKLNKSRKLSIVLYLLEKNHYFSGNGVWSEDKYKNKVDLTHLYESENLELSTHT